MPDWFLHRGVAFPSHDSCHNQMEDPVKSNKIEKRGGVGDMCASYLVSMWIFSMHKGLCNSSYVSARQGEYKIFLIKGRLRGKC